MSSCACHVNLRLLSPRRCPESLDHYTERVFLAAVTDRDAGFDAGTRNTYFLNLRIMPWKGP